MGIIQTVPGDIFDEKGTELFRAILGPILGRLRTRMARVAFPERLVTSPLRANPIGLLTLAETPA